MSQGVHAEHAPDTSMLYKGNSKCFHVFNICIFKNILPIFISHSTWQIDISEHETACVQMKH